MIVAVVIVVAVVVVLNVFVEIMGFEFIWPGAEYEYFSNVIMNVNIM